VVGNNPTGDGLGGGADSLGLIGHARLPRPAPTDDKEHQDRQHGGDDTEDRCQPLSRLGFVVGRETHDASLRRPRARSLRQAAQRQAGVGEWVVARQRISPAGSPHTPQGLFTAAGDQ
jgi:hypothetical protein